jgi:tetratricopeptide (TPR) repeat protein
MRKNMAQKRRRANLVAAAVLLLAAAGSYYLPPVHSRLAWRVEDLRARVYQAFNPPEQAVFRPEQSGDLEAALAQTRQAATPTPTLALTPTPSPGPTAAPTITPTPLPAYVSLPGVVYVDQHNRWNYCGPANLTMALNFWGWKGDRDDVARVVKPGVDDPSLDFIQRGRYDLNVMPYEMADFVHEQTDYAALWRYGGDIDLVKRLVAGGFPVVAEKGVYQRDTRGQVTWMGHYLFVTGYDDSQAAFIVQDSYKEPGRNQLVKYEEFLEGWRAFNFLFLLVYPPEHQAELFDLLGPWADAAWANTRSLEVADQEIQSLQGIDAYFAWFNKGTAHVQFFEYGEAALAYDRAFALYEGLTPEERRPYRMVWYQTGPYWAYFYTSRFRDVIALADQTLATPSTGPTLEESLYWRGMARWALGEYGLAIADLREAVRLNPNFRAAQARLAEWGAGP